MNSINSMYSNLKIVTEAELLAGERVSASSEHPYCIVTVQPLNLSPEQASLDLDSLANREKIMVSQNAPDPATLSGSVTVKARPPYTFVDYEVEGGSWDLTNPQFVRLPSAAVNVHIKGVMLSGATHYAIGVAGYR